MIRILLSARLGELRWTQADLARKTGIRASTIGDYYNEMTDRVSLRKGGRDAGGQDARRADCESPGSAQGMSHTPNGLDVCNI